VSIPSLVIRAFIDDDLITIVEEDWVIQILNVCIN
jgi:hypothetical protein